MQKQIAKQESMIATLQEGNRVLQQQIDLLNQELREVKTALEQERQKVLTEEKNSASDQNKLTATVTKLKRENAKLTGDAQWLRTQRDMFRKSLRAEEKNATTQIISAPFNEVIKATTQAFSHNGYPILASMATDQKAVIVSERKTSPPPSLELQGFRNQYLVIVENQAQEVTLLRVKASFEKVAQKGHILEATPEEIQEIELRLIGEIRLALDSSGQT